MRPCPVCASDDHAVAAELPRRVVVCRGCGLVFNNPVLSDAEKQGQSKSVRDVHRSRSAEQTLEQAHAKSLARAHRILNILGPHLRPGAEVLEIAAGDGAVLSLLRERGMSPTGLEMDAGAAKFISDRWGTPVIVGDFNTHDFGGRTFDAVVMAHIIEHLFDPVASLRKVRSLIRPGGILFLETPNILWPKVSPKRVFSLAHNFHFSPRTLCLAVHAAGFQPVHVRSFLRDSFQILARPGAAKDPPRTTPWSEVVETLNTHGKRYYGGLQFIWRKVPGIKSRYLWSVREDLSGAKLQYWLTSGTVSEIGQ